MNAMTNSPPPVAVRSIDAYMWRAIDLNKWDYLQEEAEDEFVTGYHYGVSSEHVHIFSSRKVER